MRATAAGGIHQDYMHHCATASSEAVYAAVTATAQVGTPAVPSLPNFEFRHASNLGHDVSSQG